MTKSKVYLVIPAYNEEKMIGDVIRNVAPYCSKIIVVDDGSTDRTTTRATHSKTKVLRHIINLGQGAALQTGFDYAKKEGADIVVSFDADGQFDAKEIKKIVDPIARGKADVTLGSRFLGKTIGMPLTRYLILKTAIWFTAIFSNARLTDTHNGFRGFNKKSLSKIHLTQSGMAHASEIIDQIVINKLRFVEVPVTIRYNTYTLHKGQKTTNSLQIFSDLVFKKIS